MCELCEKYGEGGRWYLNPLNYARPIYRKGTGGEQRDEMALAELRGATSLKPIIDLKDDPPAYEKAKAEYEPFLQMMVCQVVSLEDAKKMAEMTQMTKIDCLCRRTARATLEDGKYRPRSCMGVGVAMFRWEEWPERYKGGVEFISSEEAKKNLEYWHKRGMVINIMTFGTPYIGGICLCDYPDCMVIRAVVDYDIKNWLLKGHEVAKVNYDECTGCGTCAQRCQFGAIKMEVTTKKANIDMTRCFGCGACAYSCTQEAISMVDRTKFPVLKEVW